MSSEARAALERARARLDRLELYPRPVSIRWVWVATVPWLFRLPYFRRFDGYATHWVIFLRYPVAEARDDLVTHELCHVWQMQHHPLRMPLSYLATGYERNPYEQEARHAAAETRPEVPASA